MKDGEDDKRTEARKVAEAKRRVGERGNDETEAPVTEAPVTVSLPMQSIASELVLRRRLADAELEIARLENILSMLAAGDDFARGCQDERDDLGDARGLDRLVRFMNWRKSDGGFESAKVAADLSDEDREKCVEQAVEDLIAAKVIAHHAETNFEDPRIDEFVAVARVVDGRMLCFGCYEKQGGDLGDPETHVHIAAGPNVVQCAECRCGLYVE